MDTNQLFPIIFGFAGGLFCIISSILNWDFFFNSRKAALFLSVFGRTGARIFYSLLGVGLIVLGFLIAFDKGAS